MLRLAARPRAGCAAQRSSSLPASRTFASRATQCSQSASSSLAAPVTRPSTLTLASISPSGPLHALHSLVHTEVPSNALQFVLPASFGHRYSLTQRYATASTAQAHVPARRGSSYGTIALLAVLITLVFFTSVYFGNNPLFSPCMQVAFALNNFVNKMKIHASHVDGSIREGRFIFTDFAVEKKSRKKDLSATVKKLQVELRTPIEEVINKGAKTAMQEGIIIADYFAEGVNATIEMKVKNPKPDPVIRFEKMTVKDATITVIDAEKHQSNPEVPKIQFPPIKIAEMTGTDIVTGNPQKLFRRLILGAHWAGAIGEEQFEISPAGMDIRGMPIGVLSGTLSPPLRWMSDARMDLTTRHERLSDGTLLFACKVNLRNLTADVPDRKSISNADATYVPLVEFLNLQTRDRQFPLSFEMRLNENEVEVKAFERQITAGLIRAMSEKAVQHVTGFVQQLASHASQVAQKLKDK